LGGVSDTALGAAEMRAEESARPDRLFDDPYASAFVTAAPPLFPDIPSISDSAELAALIEASIAEVAIRTRFYDDYLSAACASGCHQVVLLAAGLDARAFRLNWSTGVQLFELDLPEVFAFKEKVLRQQRAESKCTRSAVAVDLREDWPARLTAAGFEPKAATAWLAEGLLPYLANDDALRLLTAVGELSTGGSQLSFEYDDSTLSQARAMPGMQEVASMWRGGLNEDPEAWLTRHDWQVRTYPRAGLAVTYGRELSQSATGGFLTAQRSHNTPVG
jgi:methyltransferase (TIGR00027 family)